MTLDLSHAFVARGARGGVRGSSACWSGNAEASPLVTVERQPLRVQPDELQPWFNAG
jgi:hypothetical protein